MADEPSKFNLLVEMEVAAYKRMRSMAFHPKKAFRVAERFLSKDLKYQELCESLGIPTDLGYQQHIKRSA